MKSQNRERRDWALLIFVVPVGFLLMILVGQLAIRILPFWSVNAGMSSKLDPDTESPRPFSLFQPILPQILTPMAWAGTYLTPSGDISFPPFFVFEPGASNTPTPVSPTPISPTPTGTAIPVSLTPISSVNPPPVVVITTKPPTAVPTTVTTPPTDEPTQDPTEEPTQDPTEEPTDEPTPVPTGYPSTPDPSWGYVPPPGDVGIGPPNGPPYGGLNQGTYTVFDISGSPITVDGNYDYDMAYFEVADGSDNFIQLDNVIIGISNSTPSCGSSYFVVFNWGDISGMLTNDYNTNITTYMENDNQIIYLSDLYNYPGTGVLINVDHAASQPPPGAYSCIVLISPYKAGSDAVEADSIQIFP